MASMGERFAAEYAAAFQQYLAGGAEASLDTAYELGRLAVTERLTLMDLAEAHHAALAKLLPEGARNGLTSAAADFFRESLATFEIATRAFRGAQETVRLEQSHAETQHALAEAAVALNERLEPEPILRAAAERARQITDGRGAVAEVRLAGSDRQLRVEVGEPRDDGDSVTALLVGRGRRAIGSLVVSGARDRQRSAPIVVQIAQMASAAIENAERYQRELLVAETLQHGLLPPALPELPGLEAAAAYWPAGDGIQVGGDFYDVFETGAGESALMIGDVCGKGPGAASLTALIRYTARAGCQRERSPSSVLRLVNAAMLDQRTDFATAVCAFLRPAAEGSMRVTLASGGHPLPLLIPAEGGVERVGAHGTLLGVVDDPSLRDAGVSMQGGDLLLLFTDGATEVRQAGRSTFGALELERLLQDCRGLPPAGVVDAIRGALRQASGGSLRDDVALLALRVHE